jgi:ApaG protein
VSTATTEGIQITVTTQYVPQQSRPQQKRYFFAYTVKIENRGELTAQLESRHWVITDGKGKVEEVRGPGVVGQQPVLRPGQSFEYTSGCILETPRGSMHGSYQMRDQSGRNFDAAIARFDLALPYTLN